MKISFSLPMRKNETQKLFSTVDATVYAMAKTLNCQVIIGSKHFMGLENVIFI